MTRELLATAGGILFVPAIIFLFLFISPIRPVGIGAPWANANIKVTIISSVLCIGTGNGSSPVLSADDSYSALMPSFFVQHYLAACTSVVGEHRRRRR